MNNIILNCITSKENFKLILPCYSFNTVDSSNNFNTKRGSVTNFDHRVRGRSGHALFKFQPDQADEAILNDFTRFSVSSMLVVCTVAFLFPIHHI